MQAEAESVHSVEMLNRRTIIFQFPPAVNAGGSKRLDYGSGIRGVGDRHFAYRADASAHVMQKHAYEFVGDIGFRPTCRFLQSSRHIETHILLLSMLVGPPLDCMPSNHRTSTRSTSANGGIS
jgi:hypothetical protein